MFDRLDIVPIRSDYKFSSPFLQNPVFPTLASRMLPKTIQIQPNLPPFDFLTLKKT